jgi:hypothetical protein
MFLGQPQIQKKKKKKKGPGKKGNKQGPRFTAQKLGNPHSTGTLQTFNFSCAAGETPQQLPEEKGIEVELTDEQSPSSQERIIILPPPKDSYS